MHQKICFLFGHRDSSEKILPTLISAVEQHITQYGVRVFIVGHYGNFDHLAAVAINHCKRTHPGITLLMLLPYHPAERPLQLHGFDGSYYPSGMETVPRRFAIVKANQYTVDHSDFIITYVHHIASNTIKLLEYAQRRGRDNLKITLLRD